MLVILSPRQIYEVVVSVQPPGRDTKLWSVCFLTGTKGEALRGTQGGASETSLLNIDHQKWSHPEQQLAVFLHAVICWCRERQSNGYLYQVCSA